MQKHSCYEVVLRQRDVHGVIVKHGLPGPGVKLVPAD